MLKSFFSSFLSFVLLASLSAIARGQHDHHAMMMAEGGEHAHHMMDMSFAGIPETQEASGTAWQPSDTPMHAIHSMSGDWMMMTHYNVFLAYDDQSGPRGGDQFNSVNWLMLMATKQTAEDQFTLRGMFSLEPWSVTPHGYPLLFQSGEAFHGEVLVDRQHPHDFFMELAARYRHLLNPDTALSLYVAPSGEPALGPPAFMHRLSAAEDPASPIGHHWMDSTHIAFGVVTAGIAQKNWQLEGSWFNGHEPDEHRWNIERPRLDSYSGRFTWNPTSEWSAQISHGYLKSPEQLQPGEHVRRTTASVINHVRFGPDRMLATTVGWGRNDEHGSSDAFLIESTYSTDHYAIFGRAEYVEKTGEELGIEPEHRKFPIKQISLGANREITPGKPWQLAVGAMVTYSFAPSDLDALYGSHPTGLWVYLRVRPGKM